MGVKGLWQLLEPSKKPLEMNSVDLVGKVVAIDVSAWLHQIRKGAPNDMLFVKILLLRICKLLYYKLKPVFIFDGDVPVLKKRVQKLRHLKHITGQRKAESLKKQLLSNLAVLHALADGSKLSPQKHQELVSKLKHQVQRLASLRAGGSDSDPSLFVLPDEGNSQFDVQNSQSIPTSSSDDDFDSSQKLVHLPDFDSPSFSSLPLQKQHDALMVMQEEMKYTNNLKSNNPNNLNEVSSTQLSALVERSKVSMKLKQVKDDLQKNLLNSLGEGMEFGSFEKIECGEFSTQGNLGGYILVKKSVPSSKNPKAHSEDVKKETPANGVKPSEILDKPQSLMNDFGGLAGYFDPEAVVQPMKFGKTTEVQQPEVTNDESSKKMVVDSFKEKPIDLPQNIECDEPTICKPCEVPQEVSVPNEVASEHSEDEEFNCDDFEEVMPSRSTNREEESVPESESPQHVVLDASFDSHPSLNVPLDKLMCDTETKVVDFEKVAKAATAVTNSDYLLCEQILRLFGVPFVRAPFEAEAMCAWLNEKNLVSAVITDDSDCLLFGGLTVFKHFASKKHDPAIFHADTIHTTLGLSREALVAIALISGCDYTEGIPSAGPSMALHILTQFKSVDPFCALQKFASWHAKTKQKLEQNLILHDTITPEKQKFLKLCLPEDFPDRKVYDAFMAAQNGLSHSLQNDLLTNGFTWAQPNFDDIVQFCQDKLKWSKDYTNSLICIPLQKQASNTTGVSNQPDIRSFVSVRNDDNGNRMNGLSKSLRSSLERYRLAIESSSDEAGPSASEKTAPAKKRIKKSKNFKSHEPAAPSLSTPRGRLYRKSKAISSQATR